MKSGIAFINKKDLFAELSSELIGNSFENLLLRADRKAEAENDLASHPGVQVFGSNIQPKAREVELTFKVEGMSTEDYIAKYNALLDEIDNDENGGNFTLYIPMLNSTYRLRRRSYMSLDTISSSRIGKLVVLARELNPKDRAND